MAILGVEGPLTAAEGSRIGTTAPPGQAVGAKHPRQGRIINAISQVPDDEGYHMQARDVHARVETLLGEPVRWASVKATLAGNLKGPPPRFVRVARGRYGIPDASSPHSIHAQLSTRPRRAPKSA
jgi:hypothetical protein